ncbi:hypothetical protein THOM_3190, partial [Trachipleistophora hominis]
VVEVVPGEVLVEVVPVVAGDAEVEVAGEVPMKVEVVPEISSGLVTEASWATTEMSQLKDYWKVWTQRI